MRLVSRAFAFALTSVLAASAGAAPLDGEWCAPDGRILTIAGEDVITPSGQETAAGYDRDRNLIYSGPQGDAEEGQEILVSPAGSERIALRRTIAGREEPAEQWQRCPVLTTTAIWLLRPPVGAFR
jgi:hypothetical protein